MNLKPFHHNPLFANLTKGLCGIHGGYAGISGTADSSATV
jgi:hypothetical protein